MEFFFDEAEVAAGRKRAAATRKPAPKLAGCAGCGLSRGRITPRMEPHGQGTAGILIVGEAPGQTEDEQGRPFKGQSGRMLREALAESHFDMDFACVATNVVQCRPVDDDGKNRAPEDDEIRACSPRLRAQIERINPRLIIALGTPAISQVLHDAPFGPTATNMHGRVVPSWAWRPEGTWVACSFHPAWFIRENGKFDRRLGEVLRAGFAKLDEPSPALLDENSFEVVEDVGAVEKLLTRLGNGDRRVSLDFETTGLDPWAEDFEILTFAVADSVDYGYCVPLFHPHARWAGAEVVIFDLLKWFVESPCPKVLQNWQFEEIVSRVYLQRENGVRNVVRDTMLCEHVLDNRGGCCGQEFQEYVRYGSRHKAAVNVAALSREYLDVVARYNTLDARYCLRWAEDQDKELECRRI